MQRKYVNQQQGFKSRLNKSPNLNNLFLCIITSENNNKQHLVSYFYTHVALLRVCFFTQELAHSVVVNTSFDKKYCIQNYAAATFEPMH